MAIKVFRSDQLGAPVINGMAGTLITALDAILVNGYGQVNVSSITRAGSTATVETAAAHGFKTGDIALIAGAGQAEYNGEHEVQMLSATSFTFAVAGEPASPATGTITSKRAPAGFSKVFAATNKGAYRSNDITSRRHFLRVNDSGSTLGGSREATVHAYETMTDVDIGTGMYPTAAQHTKGFFWQKSDIQDGVGRHWLMVTDGKTLYHFSYFQARVGVVYTYDSIENPGTNIASLGFGDIIGFKPGDAYANFLTSTPQENQFSSTQNSGLFYATTSITSAAQAQGTSMIMFARDFTGVEGPRPAQIYASGLGGNFGSSPYISYPHVIDNGFYMVPALAVQGAPALIRGRLPGFFESMHGACFPNATVVENVQGYVGRKFMMIYGKQANSICSCLIDITGPWDS